MKAKAQMVILDSQATLQMQVSAEDGRTERRSLGFSWLYGSTTPALDGPPSDFFCAQLQVWFVLVLLIGGLPSICI